MSNQLNPQQDTASLIAEKIGSYYHILQEKKEMHKIIREVAEEKLLDYYIEENMEEAVEELKELLETGQISEEEAIEAYGKLREKALFNMDRFYKFDDILLGYKSRSTKIWDESFDEVLRENKVLHRVKKVLKKEEQRYNIASFALPNEKYMKIHESLNLSKEEKAAASDALKEEQKALKKELQLQSFDEVISAFKSNKEVLSSLQEIYEKDRANLFELMIKENLSEVAANEEGTMSFKMFERFAGYDTEKIAKQKIEKKFVFFYAQREDGTVECKDWFTGETFSFTKSATHDGHVLSFRKNTLSIDGVELETPDIKDVSLFKKSDYKEIEKLKWQVAYGTVEMNGLDFLAQCKTSTTLVEKMIDEGKLPPNVLDRFRYMGKEEDIQLIFEMIEEEADNNRKFFFVKKRQKRAARYERLQRREA